MAAEVMVEIVVEVVYVTKSRQFLTSVTLAAGSRVDQSIEASGLFDDFPELESNETQVGIYGKKVSRDRVLADGDRVEVYRPLEIDPMQARRNRAARKKP
ncbi:MAG: putative ubiquitin-RnfH superfamily antitoxin RatB of RatAB toxin-antitoxin module [Candidatus Azotimanducaceae bacterium]|jgi:putative ubiquitin-RnfH superfamily antitoxin RatB of RatAB toxin-antitoxin module